MSVSRCTPTIFPIWRWYLSTSQYWDVPMVQWLRICLSMKGMQIWSLVGELTSYMPQVKCAWALQLEKRTGRITEPCTTTKTQQSQKKKVNPDFAHVTYYLTFSHNLFLYISSWTSSSLVWRQKREILIEKFFFNQK